MSVPGECLVVDSWSGVASARVLQLDMEASLLRRVGKCSFLWAFRFSRLNSRLLIGYTQRKLPVTATAQPVKESTPESYPVQHGTVKDCVFPVAYPTAMWSL
jgi:hypothetical protein